MAEGDCQSSAEALRQKFEGVYAALAEIPFAVEGFDPVYAFEELVEQGPAPAARALEVSAQKRSSPPNIDLWDKVG